GRLPALALDERRGPARGGAAPLLRRHHARQAATLPLLCAPPPYPGVWGGGAVTLPPRDPGIRADHAERGPLRARRGAHCRAPARHGRGLSVPPRRQAAPCPLWRGASRGPAARGER